METVGTQVTNEPNTTVNDSSKSSTQLDQSKPELETVKQELQTVKQDTVTVKHKLESVQIETETVKQELQTVKNKLDTKLTNSTNGVVNWSQNTPVVIEKPIVTKHIIHDLSVENRISPVAQAKANTNGSTNSKINKWSLKKKSKRPKIVTDDEEARNKPEIKEVTPKCCSVS